MEDSMGLQSDLQELVSWINQNLLKLNINKCKICSYGKGIQSYKYFIDGTELERVEEIKDLGVINFRF